MDAYSLLHDKECGTSLRYYATAALQQLEKAAHHGVAVDDHALAVLRRTVSSGLDAAACRSVRGSVAPHGALRPSMAVLKPRQERLLRTLVDRTMAAPLLSPAVPVQPAWRDMCDRHHLTVHEAAEATVLAASSSTSWVETQHARIRFLRRLLQRCGLLSNAPASSPEDASIGNDDDDEVMNGEDGALGGLGIAYCMMPLADRCGVLMRAALDESTSVTPATARGLSAAEAVSVLLSLALADRDVAYAFPQSSDAGPARGLLVALSDAGFLHPIAADGVRMFVIHAALRDTVFAVVNTHQQQRKATTGGADHDADLLHDTPLTFSPFAAALASFSHHAKRPRDHNDETDAAVARRHDGHHPKQPHAAVHLETVSTAAGGEAPRRGTALKALMRLGHSKDVNAISHHAGRSTDTASSAAVWSAVSDTIVTETNYRIYVYLRPCDASVLATDPSAVMAALPHSSRTLLRLLDQFAVRDVLVPRFAVYRLTRGRFLAAVRKGVTQQQILAFLSSRAHPSAVAKDPSAATAATAAAAGADSSAALAEELGSSGSNGDVRDYAAVPRSIGDQLALWEREARRVQFQHRTVLLQAPNSIAAARIVALLDADATGAGGADAVVARSGLLFVVTREAYDKVLAARLPAPV
jgi:hypothetical protein